MNGIGRTNAIIAMTPGADHSGKEGYAVKVSSATAALVSAVADVPLGVLLEGADTTGKDSIAICDGGLAGTVRVKLDGTPGTVVVGTRLMITTSGTFKADAGSGARTVMATAMEPGVAGELIEAVLFTPIYSAT